MTNDEADGGVHESVAANMRAAAMMAMQVAERLAKAWTDLARDAERRATAEAGLLAARIEAERTAAIATLTVVERPEWWERASIEEVAGMVETAAIWQDRDPAAAAALVTIDREVQARYGVTLEALQQRTQTVQDRAEAIEAVAVADALDGTSKERLTDRRAEQVQTVGDAGTADVARDGAEVAYDSTERRAAFAAALEGSAEPDLVAGRIRADVNFAHPAEQATAVRGSSSVSRGRAASTPDRARQRPPRSR